MCEGKREAITQAEQTHHRREQSGSNAIPAVEVGARRDRRASDENKESARRPMLVV
jgi:hypothetical protein